MSPGSVALSVGKVEADLSGEVVDPRSRVAAVLVGVRRVPVPARGHRSRGPLYLRFNLSYRDVEELLLERDVEVDHVSVYRWVQRFTPLLADAARFGLWAPLVTQTSIEVPPRSRLTAWLRHQLADATARANRAASEVAAQYQVAWHTVRKELIAAAAAGCPPCAQRC